MYCNRSIFFNKNKKGCVLNPILFNIRQYEKEKKCVNEKLRFQNILVGIVNYYITTRRPNLWEVNNLAPICAIVSRHNYDCALIKCV